MMQVVIPYAPRPWAIPFHASTKRWLVLVIHRRAGKTTAAINHLQRDALKTPNSRWAFIAPTYKQAKNVAWDIIKFYSSVVPGVSYNEVELTVRYPNGARITLYGADNPDSLRGIGLWGVVFDEYSQQPSNIFTEIIRPALADHGGYAIWIGTPKGKNEFFRLWEKGKTEEDWLSLLLTVDDTLIIPQAELDDSRKVMSQDEYQQEWFCSFEASTKGAIYAAELLELRQSKRTGVVPYDRSLPVHTVWDLGKGANMAIGFYQNAFGQLRKIDFWEGVGDQALPEAIREVKNKPYVYGKHFAPHDIQAVDLSTGKTRLETAKKLGLSFTVVPEIGVWNGINAAKLAFSRLWVNEATCQPWLDAVSQYHREWDENRGMFKDIPYHDWTSHGADEFRYAAVVADKMDNETDQEVAQLIPNADPY